jgi:hypothetical protein
MPVGCRELEQLCAVEHVGIVDDSHPTVRRALLGGGQQAGLPGARRALDYDQGRGAGESSLDSRQRIVAPDQPASRYRVPHPHRLKIRVVTLMQV